MATVIEVTATDIAAGTRLAKDSCPVALALHRATGRPWLVGQYGGHPEGERGSAPWTAEVRTWLDRFDRGEPVEPFAFELPTPRPRFYLVNKTAGTKGELLVNEVPGDIDTTEA